MHATIEKYGVGNVALLDGGMGQELRKRATNDPTSLWSAQVLIDNPGLVRKVHEDYIRAGARIITTNTYATVRNRLAEHSTLENRFEELVGLAVSLAKQAVTNSGESVLIAGSLPPLSGSYMPHQVQTYDVIEPIYRELAALIAPGVDVFICETMSTADEARAAATAAAATGKPVWVAWTLADEGEEPLLRSGENISVAWRALSGIEVEGVFVNCSAPESISRSIKKLASLGAPLIGAYANGFQSIPKQWSVKDGVDRLGQREDLGPAAYGNYVRSWIADGANIVGGCCEVGPDHISYLGDKVLPEL